MLLETTNKYSVDSESKAKDMIEEFRQKAADKGYIIKKAGYEYKTKKAKGEVNAEAWVVSVTFIFSSLWEDLV